MEHGLLVILRGVNMNPGAEPDDLISVRIWIEPHRVITLRQLRFKTLAELRAAAQAGRAPDTTGGLLARIAIGLASRIGPSVDNLELMLDDIEAAMLDVDDDSPSTRSKLAEIRRQSITLRRHLVPQRQAMQQLSLLEHPVLSRGDRTLLRTAAEQVARSVDGLEEVRDRSAVTQDELRARHEARVGRTVYMLTLVATIALPLGLITGLLGINVGGMPMADSNLGFAVVCGLMVLIAVGEVYIFKKMRIL
jgi:zinc transporter